MLLCTTVAAVALEYVEPGVRLRGLEFRGLGLGFRVEV